ncbi:hypothetical protein GCM10008938_45020 [Deinococcus roseus]|uniref:Cytochrome c domain-containing protein n=1 Tax=Deinococcus roseus TaxID=392414 RepID=A0ABQ2DES3_9DEIO|nr:hypothetical protein GCM10008938_45020 [Deinococcus roseus]
MILVGIAAVSAVGNRKNAKYSVRISQAQYAAESGLEEAVYQVWHKIWSGVTPTSSADYRLKLNASSEPFKTPGGNFTVNRTLSGGGQYNISITRRPMANNDVVFDIVSTGTLQDGTTRVLSQVFKVAGTLFNGFDYALLTNNVNCIFCHTTIQDMSALGGAAAPTNPQDRVKVASLETMQIRPDPEEAAQHDHVDTVIAGTLYLRGKFQDKSGNDLTSQMNTLSLQTTQTVDQGAITSRTMQNLTPQNCQTVTNCKDKAYKNFYVNYPDKANVDAALGGKWPDGVLPDKFPLPIPEKGTPNNTIDQLEWDEVVDNSNNNMDEENPKGKIMGGKITINPSAAGLYDWPAGNATEVTSTKWSTKQNVVLDGTSSTLKLEGTTYINGDVVIRGKIAGTGKIIASGNVYVMGDVTYDCAPAATCDYTKPETLPQVGLIAGGNMMIGDFLTRRMQSGDTGSNSLKAADQYVDSGGNDPALSSCTNKCNIMSFSAREATIFNRAELEKAVLNPSYTPRFYTYEKDAPVFFYNVLNSEGTDDYRSSSVIGFEVVGGVLKDKYGNNFTATTGVKTSAGTKNVTAAGLKAIWDKANKLTMSGTNAWISKQQLKSLWVKSVECASTVDKNGGSCGTATRNKGPLRTDGLLYSSNAIFSIARGKHGTGQDSRLQGRWDLRGSMAAADTGVLVTGSNPSAVDSNSRNKLTEGWNTIGTEGVDNTTERGLSIYYDARMKSFMKIKQDDLPILQRSEWKVGTK